MIRGRKIKIILLGVALILCLTLGMAATQKMPYTLTGKDTLTFTYPLFHLLSTSLKEGHFPAWDRSTSYPVHAESQGGFFYPIHLILAILLPLPLSYTVNVVLHLALGFFFTFVFARELGQRPLGSLFAGLVFAFGGFFVARIDTLFVINNGIWLPLILFFIERGFKRQQRVYWLMAGGCIGIALLAGHFQYTIMAVLLSSLYFIFRLEIDSKQKGWPHSRVKNTGFWLACLVLAIGLAAVQLVPTFELVRTSNRQSLSYETFTNYSLFPLQLLSIICPYFFGMTMPTNIARPFLETAGDYWGLGSFWEASGYTGLLPLVLAIASLRFKERTPRTFFSYAIPVFLILALGKYTPIAKLLYYVPVLNLFRIPARFLYLACFSISILAGYGFDHLRSGDTILARRLNKGGKALLLFVFGLIIAATTISLYAKPLQSRLTSIGLSSVGIQVQDKSVWAEGFYETKIRRMTKNMGRALALTNTHLQFWLLMATIGALVLIYGNSHRWPAVALQGCILIITIADISFFALACIKSQLGSADIVRNAPATVHFLSGQDKGLFRIHTSEAELIDIQQPYALLHPNYGTLFHLDSFTFRCSIKNRRYGAIKNVLTNANYALIDPNPPTKTQPLSSTIEVLHLFSILNIRYILCHRNLVHKDLVKVYDEQGIKIYENRQTMPRAYLVPKAIIMPKETDLLNVLLEGSFDYHRTVLLEEKPQNAIKASTTNGLRPARIHIEKYEDSSVELTVDSVSGGYLVLADFHYPGWSAFIDGKKTKIYRGNYLQRVVVVTPGAHRIHFRYRPMSLIAGLSITILSTMVFLFFIARSYFQNHRD